MKEGRKEGSMMNEGRKMKKGRKMKVRRKEGRTEGR
jgi:hypothetical protein